MPFRDTFFSAVRAGFEVADEIFVGIEDEDKNLKLQDQVSRIDDKMSQLEDLAGEGNTFLEDLMSMRSSFEDPVIFSPEVLGNSENLFLALRLADTLTEDVWDSDVEEGSYGLRITELDPFDAMSKPDFSRVRIAAFDSQIGEDRFIAYLDFRGVQDLEELFGDSSFGELDGDLKPLAAMCLLVVGSPDNLLGRCWCISRLVDPNALKATLKYMLVLHGCILSAPKPLSPASDLAEISQIVEVSDQYLQFFESFEILGEFNSRTSILDGFLSLYHVLENYMLRAKIASATNTPGQHGIFSIRDFKRLSIASEGAEQKHLEELFRSCWNKLIGGSNLADYSQQRFQEFTQHSGFNNADFDDFLRRLTVVKVGQNNLDIANWNEVRVQVPRIIYLLRCSIVHNKETEFHVSNRELDLDTRKLFLEIFCIPVMKRAAFGMPSVGANNPVIYNRKSLELY
tara:strand:- start:37493 stop:38860 length:1368 start_codon:yes stop_codon:yes gene_type:complete